MSGNNPDLERALELYRDATGPDRAARDRVWESVQGTVSSSADGPAATAATHAPRAGGTELTLVGGLLLGALGVWYGTRPAPPSPPPPLPPPLAAEAATQTPAPPPPIESTDGPLTPGQRAEPATTALEELPTTDKPTTDKPTTEVAVLERPRTAAPRRARAGRSSPPSTLAAEMKLMTAAQAAAKQGNHRRALLKLRTHRRRFPAGVMAEEREAKRVLTLCALGQDAAARRAAARFLAHFPGSPQSSRVQRACAEPKP